MTGRSPAAWLRQLLNKYGRLLTLLPMAMSAGLMATLLVKSIVDVDSHFDSWWYHLPWAARLAGLVPPDAYGFEPLAEVRFEGFPVLPELVQGMLWRLGGRVEFANLASFGSLVVFILFLRAFFRVDWWLAVPALLAVPLIQAQATSTYVDLFANLPMAALVLLLYQILATRRVEPRILAGIAVSAIVAANSKLQLLPLVALTLLAAFLASVPQLVSWLKMPGTASHKWLWAGVTALALAAVFFVPLKNAVLHGNPVYPLRIELLGHVLNHAESLPPEDLGGGAAGSLPQAGKWLYSVFELGMGPVFKVDRWSVDSAAPEGSPLGIQGGLFGAYVVLQLLFFAYLAREAAPRERKAALVVIGFFSAAAAVMPASHLLRYYMFWFISLIALNLHYLCAHHGTASRMYVSAALFAVVLLVIDASDQNFVRPRFYSAEDLLAERVDPRILAKVQASASTCLVLDWANQPFLYAPIWHTGRYYVKAGPFDPGYADEVANACDDIPVIRSEFSRAGLH